MQAHLDLKGGERAAFGPDHDTVGFDDTLREHGERTLLVVSQDSEKHAPLLSIRASGDSISSAFGVTAFFVGTRSVIGCEIAVASARTSTQ
jgi:hypothetical protein